MLGRTSTISSFWKWEKIQDLAERGTRVRVIAKESPSGYGIWEGLLIRVSDTAFGLNEVAGDSGETRSTVILQFSDVRHIDSALFGVEGDPTCPPPEDFFEVAAETATVLETVVSACFIDLRKIVRMLRFHPEEREGIGDAMVLPDPLRRIAETTSGYLWIITLIDRQSRLFPCLTLTVSIKQHLYERFRDIELRAYTRFMPLDERYARENSISDNLRAMPQRSLRGRLRAAWAAINPSFDEGYVASGNAARRSTEGFPVQFITCERTARGAVVAVR